MLKGLLDRGDEQAMAVAVAERRFLAEVEHPNIVKIHNFVEHDGDGYIVMEFVNGISLREMLEARRAANGGRADPLPVEQAIAFCLEILPALGHLHDLGLAYCDFKPDNVIHTPGSSKLIDLGGVYRMDDQASPVYGTVGYQAPEIAETGPTRATDLFTVGRTLAVLCTDFAGYQSTYRFTLPARGDVELYTEHDSLHRFLLRATALDPDARFQTAEEMAAQLLGVLREIVAGDDRLAGARRRARRSPRPVVARPTPPTGGPCRRRSSTPTIRSPRVILSIGAAGPEAIAEQRSAARGSTARTRRARPLAGPGADRRRPHRRGRRRARRRRRGRAVGLAGVLVPGRWPRSPPVPRVARPASSSGSSPRCPASWRRKLALGVAAELAGDHAAAARWYEVVSRTDPGVHVGGVRPGPVPRRARRPPTAAVAAYGRVPDTSSAHVDARVAEARLLAADGAGPLTDVLRAAAIVERLPLDAEQRGRAVGADPGGGAGAARPR